MELIRKWQLAVLQVRLDLSDRAPRVATTLATYPGGTRRALWADRYQLESFGLAGASTPPSALTVPAELPAEVAGTLAASGVDEAALWLRLVPPYGYLGAVPWEEALADVGLPLLRVPDRMPAAVDPGRRFTAVVAVCARADGGWASAHVRGLLAGLRRHLPEVPLDMHVFADARTATELRADPALVGPELNLHEPADARAASRSRSASGRPARRNWAAELYPVEVPGQVWADWIVKGLAGRAARALHIVADGLWNGDRPAIAVSLDPADERGLDPRSCAYVAGEQVRALSDQLGAATLSFGSPPGNMADTATRMIADSLGQQRPGPTLYSAVGADPDASALSRAYAYLVSPNKGIPQHRSLFGYLQPEHVAQSLAQPWPPVAGPDAAPDPGRVTRSPAEESAATTLGTYYAEAENVPSWVVASERFIEAESATLGSVAAAPPEGVTAAYDEGSNAALAEIRELMAKHVRET